jgi:hypothetical protein
MEKTSAKDLVTLNGTALSVALTQLESVMHLALRTLIAQSIMGSTRDLFAKTKLSAQPIVQAFVLSHASLTQEFAQETLCALKLT